MHESPVNELYDSDLSRVSATFPCQSPDLSRGAETGSQDPLAVESCDGDGGSRSSLVGADIRVWQRFSQFTQAGLRRCGPDQVEAPQLAQSR